MLQVCDYVVTLFGKHVCFGFGGISNWTSVGFSHARSGNGGLFL